MNYIKIINKRILERSCTFHFSKAYIWLYGKNGGAFILLSICMTGILGFLEFLKSAVFVVRIYTRRKFISRAINGGRRKKLFRANGKRR